MCILERVSFACTHTIPYAQRYHTQPTLHTICLQPLLTINRELPFDCPTCRLGNMRGFPYTGVPFGLVVRDDSLIGVDQGGGEDWDEWEVVQGDGEKAEGDRVLDEIETAAEVGRAKDDCTGAESKRMEMSPVDIVLGVGNKGDCIRLSSQGGEMEYTVR